MPFLNVKRTTLPTDITLPVAAQTDGTKAANFFPGWDSPILTVFSTFGTPGGFRKVCEENFDGRIAVKSTDQWRDGKITTFAQSVQILARLTASGRALVCNYSGAAAGGQLTIGEASGINPALPILDQNAPRNGTIIREIYSTATGGGSMTSRFGPSGTDVVANYNPVYASGDTLTFILDAFRITVMWRNTVIVDLPYDGWTLMEAGRWALAPTSGYGLLDSAMDFTPLSVLPSVANSIPHASDFSNPAAPIINAYDVKMRELRQVCSVAAGSTTVTVSNAAAFTPYIGEYFFIEAGTVEMVVTPNPSNVGNGFLKQPYIPAVSDTYHVGVEGDESHWIEGVYTVVIQPGATQWRLTAPNATVLGTVPIDNRINSIIRVHLMQGSIPFVAGDNFTITVTCKGETTTDTYDGLKAAGRLRTIGVGGKWPASNITEAQIAANQNPDSLPNNSMAMITDGARRGKAVFRGVASWAAYAPDFFYGNRSQPRALKAKLVSVNTGANTIQLSVAATAASAGAYIWLDSWYALDRIMRSDLSPYANVTVRLPAGHFGMGAPMTPTGRDGWGIRGEGQGVTVMEMPRGIVGGAGAPSFGMIQSTDCYLRDFDYIMQDNPMAGYTMGEPNGPSGSQAFGFSYGIKLQGCEDSWVDDVSVYNCGSNAFELAECTACTMGGVINPVTDANLWMTQRSMIEAYNIYPSQLYRGWRGAVTASHGACTISGYRIRQAYAYPGVESFLAAGVIFEYFDLENSPLNCNGSDGAIYREINQVYKKHSWPNGSMDIASGPMISSNQNQPDSVAGTLTLINVNSIQEGYYAETGDITRGITVDAGKIIMRGSYDPTVADDGNRRGLIVHALPFTPGTNAINDSAIIVADGGRLDIEGYRIVGSPTTGWPWSINSQTSVIGGVRIVNNIMDVAPPATAVITPVTGNITNAAWLAL